MKTNQKRFRKETDIPIALYLLEYIPRLHDANDIQFETASTVIYAICFLILECKYQFIVTTKEGTKTYSYQSSLIENFKDSYAFKLTSNFRDHIVNGDDIVVLDKNNLKVKAFRNYRSEN